MRLFPTAAIKPSPIELRMEMLDQYTDAFLELARNEEVAILDRTRLRAVLSRYTSDDIERVYDACLRFGIKNIFQNI